PDGSTPSRAEARARLGWQPGGRYLLTAARLTAWKGVDALIDALASLPDVRLIVAGDGPEFGALKLRAAERGVAARVEFLGKVPHERMDVLLRAADYLALYSGYEGLSHTLLEALVAGTPVIASARGGNPEVVRDGVNGLLAAHPDPAALAAVLRRAFEGDTQSRLAAGTAAGLERFDWARLVEQTDAALVAALRAKRPKNLRNLPHN
ncbi:MAG: glycosyltransferase family 4 protein, partial [Anaerolineae bacterium]|nr:glycosyltransferase family 4 protein [Anaerolineae bacterium]